MRKSLGNIELQVVFSGKQHADPLAEVRRADANIHRDVEHFALHHAAQLGLRIAELVVQAAQHPARRARMIVLHELVLDAGARQHVLAIGFHEEAARVLVDSRLHHQYVREARFR